MQQGATSPASSTGLVEFTRDLSAAPTPLPHFWEHTMGSAHVGEALRADWQDQLRRAHYELGFRYVRFHGLLSDRMGNLICHKEEFLYSFFNPDQIFVFLLFNRNEAVYRTELHAGNSCVGWEDGFQL